jgi:hypothetical protein
LNYYKKLFYLIMQGSFLKNFSILFITTHKRKKIKIKVHKTWKRWKAIRNIKKKNKDKK